MSTLASFKVDIPTGIVASLVLVTVVGCGEQQDSYPSARVTGRVTVDGEAIAEGSINFYPKRSGQGPTVAADIVDGVYTAEQVPLGDVLVQFMATRETGRMIPGSGTDVPEVLSIIPTKYQSGVELSITGDSEHDFELTSS